MQSSFLPPFSRQTLETIYLLAGNINITVPFHKFLEVSNTYDRPNNITTIVSRLRPIFKEYGLEIVSIKDYGYKCMRIKK